jgi:hypothetical protein
LNQKDWELLLYATDHPHLTYIHIFSATLSLKNVKTVFIFSADYNPVAGDSSAEEYQLNGSSL